MEINTKVQNVQLKNPTVESAAHYVRMVGIGDLLGMTLIGPPGMGKTHLVRQVLDEMQIPYEVYGGHISLAETYEYLCENKDKLIFFDDVSQVINRPEIMEMLKQALNPGARERILNYRAKNVLRTNVPNKFVFTGSIIFAFNTMDKNNPNVKAIMDRAPVIELKYSRKETLEAMYKIAEGESGGLMVKELVGDGRIKRTELAKEIAIKKDMSPRNAQRRINEFLELEEIYQNKMKGGDISIKEFKWLLGDDKCY
jgi:hypothetical protein